jgi:hypothetical protein
MGRYGEILQGREWPRQTGVCSMCVCTIPHPHGTHPMPSHRCLDPRIHLHPPPREPPRATEIRSDPEILGDYRWVGKSPCSMKHAQHVCCSFHAHDNSTVAVCCCTELGKLALGSPRVLSLLMKSPYISRLWLGVAAGVVASVMGLMPQTCGTVTGA